jgi:hypothetical protein
MRLEAFLFCEMARNEANGQISLIGLYPGSMVIIGGLPPGDTAPTIPNLHAVVILGEMQGVRSFRQQCTVRSNGVDVVTVPGDQIVRPDPLPFQNIIFGLSPFPCTQGFGEYEFRITIQPDGSAHPTTYSKTFTVERHGTERPQH